MGAQEMFLLSFPPLPLPLGAQGAGSGQLAGLALVVSCLREPGLDIGPTGRGCRVGMVGQGHIQGRLVYAPQTSKELSWVGKGARVPWGGPVVTPGTWRQISGEAMAFLLVEGY